MNITTRQVTSETTVTLNVGDHPFIKHESVVNYANAAHMNLRDVEAVMRGQHGFLSIVCEQRDSCSAELLRRIQEGLLASSLVKRRIKEYCRAAWQQH